MADNIKLITYADQTVMPIHDAIVHDIGVGQSGILYGCEVTGSGNVLSISNGYGVIKGRVFEVAQKDINVQLAASGQMYGYLTMTLDLSNTESPLTMAVTQNSTQGHTITTDEDANYTNGIYEMELATFTVSTTEISNVQRVAKTIHGGVRVITETDWALDDLVDDGWYYFDHLHFPADHPSTLVNGWLRVLSGVTSKKQILCREGSETTQADTFVRSFTNGAWTSWRRLVSENEMYYMPGEEVDLRISCGGYLSSGKTYIGGFIPLWKPVHSSVRSVTVINRSNYTITVRQNGQYLIADVNPVSLGATCAVRAGGLDLNLNKASGFGGTNNDTLHIVGYIRVRFNG